MTEQERIRYAIQYMNRMAEGINPMTDEPVAPDDLVRDPHITNCLLYVADILQSVLENGSTHPAAAPVPHHESRDNSSFMLTPEQYAQLHPSDQPQCISAIARELNQFAKENGCRNISAHTLNLWLISLGMLEEKDAGQDKPAKVSTEQGNRIGISSSLTQNSKGLPYYRTVFSAEAQQFIFDNLDALCAFIAQGN